MPPQFTLPPDTRAVGTGNPPSDVNAHTDALNAMGAGYNVLNAAFAGGADPTGGSDSTAAFAACAPAAAAAGVPMTIPPGLYVITSTLNWKLNGLIVRGSGWDNTVIQQNTANIPVVQVAGQGQDISGLTLKYQTAQVSGNTSAICMEFGDDTVGSCWMSSYRELNLIGGSTLMAVNPAISTAAGLFSCTLMDINLGQWSVSAISLIGNNGGSLANCSGCVFSNIYLSNSAASCTSYPVFMKNWDEFVFNQLNIEHCVVTNLDGLGISNVHNAVINSLHTEALTISATGHGLILCNQTDSIVINGLRAYNHTYAGASVNQVLRFASAAGSVTVNGFNEAACTVTTPSHPLVDFASVAGCTAAFTNVAATQVTVNTVNSAAGDVFQDGDGLVVAELIQVLSGSYTLASNTSAQPALNATANGALAVQGLTAYEFECVLSVSGLSASSHTLSFGLGGTASFTSAFYQAIISTGAGTLNATTGLTTVATAAATVLTAATTNTNFQMIARGVMRINAGGTIIPQVTQGTASAAGVVAANSFFRCWPIGSGSVTSVGNWS